MENYRIKDGQDLFDVATSLYGSPEFVLTLVRNNSGITQVNDTGITQIDVVYDASIKENRQTLTLANSAPVASVNTYSTWEGQSLFDLALQVNGNIESVLNLVRENGFNNVNQNVFSTQILLPTSYANKKAQEITIFMKKKGINMNTSTPIIRTGSGFSGGFRQSAFH